MASERTTYSDNLPMIGGSVSEWSNPEHALGYLARADGLPHRREGEGVLLDHVPCDARQILDLGTGDGRLLALLRLDRPDCVGVGLDVSEPMLKAARERFTDQRGIELVRHDLAEPLPDLGSFDAVVSCFAIHHVSDTRKRMVYAEAFDRLEPGGVFCNLETRRLANSALAQRLLSGARLRPGLRRSFQPPARR
jgi:tRNA (cmo5U34)-methyltransferase